MDMGDSNFSEQPSSFILLPSQDETQQESQEEAQMRHILTTLPGLQPPAVQTLTKLIDVGDTSAEESKTGSSKVIVADSEVETHHKAGDMIETSDFATVSESVDDSADNADVTVLEKKMADDSDMIADTEISASSAAEPTSPAQPASPVEPDRSGQEDVLTDDRSRSRSSSPNESSFQSKDRSNLGSYDQCELYGTQRGHAHGQRFQQVQSSQDDVFGDNDNDNGTDYVSTPAEHIGSLQLSLKPMLVPETVDEMESEVPLSPPFMIPASPTDQEQTEEDTVYNVNEANTLADSTKSFNYSGSSSSSKGSGDRTVIERQPAPSGGENNIGDVVPTEEQDFMMRPGPTMAGEVIQQASEQPESLHLHFSESHPSGSSDAQQQMESTESPEIIEHPESPEIIEYVTETPKKRPPTEEITSSQNREKSVSQSEARIIRVCTPKMKASPILPRELTKTPEDVIIIDSGSVNVDSGSVNIVEEEEEQLSLRLSPSQGEITQSNKQKRATQSQKSAKGKKSRHKADIYEKPAVVWKDNEEIEFPVNIPETREATVDTSVMAGTSKSSSGDRFSDDFHLSLPKGGDLLHPVSEKGVALETRENTSSESRQLSASGKLKESETFTEPSVEHPKSPTLTMSMIQTDSEAVPEHVFRLEKPEIRSADSEAASEENQQEDIFRRAKVKQARKHWKYIQEEDSDEDEYISPRQPQGITSSLPRSALPTTGTAEEPETAENLGQQVDTLDEQQEEPQPVPQHQESNDYTMSYDAEAAVLESSKLKISGKASFVEQVSEMEVLEAVPLEMAAVQPADSVELSADHQEQSEIMRPPSTPVMSQDKINGQDRPKTPAHVQNILKAYSDIISKKTPLRQRSASVDISQLPGSAVKTSLARQFSHEPSVAQSHSLPQLQSRDSQSGKLSQLVIPSQASFSNGASISKGGSLSPKGGSASPKGDSLMSAKKASKDLGTDDVLKQKKSGETSPNSNPPKSPKGIDIADISHELLESFRQSKRSKHRHHSGSHTSLKGKQADQTNGSVKHSDHKGVQINGENTTRSVTSAGSMSSKNILSSPAGKTLSTSRTTESCSMTVSSAHVGIENQNLTSGVHTPGQGQNRTSLPEANNVINVQKSSTAVTPSLSKSTRKAEKLKKSKKLMSSAERMRRRSSVDSNISAQITTGSFVSSTQRFLQKETSIEPQSTTASGTQDTSRVQGHDPFSFQGSQSQTSHREMRSAPRLKKYTSSSFERTPVSTRKRKKVIYKKSGVKKQKLADEAGNPSPVKQADKFQKATSPVSQSSDITVTTIGSLQSIPSSISHASPVGEPVLSPSSSGSRASTGTSQNTQRRLSIEPLPDTLQLQSEDDNYQRVTVVTTVMERYIKETVTKREVIGSQGQVLESKETVVQKGEPVIVDEKTHKKVQLIYVPSPSRSVSSLTSGDLADISSSMSRSYSSSLGSKVSTTGGSFDQSQKSPDHSEAHQRSRVQREAEKSSQKEAGLSQYGRRSEFLEPQPSTSKIPYELLKKDTFKKQKPTTPEDSSKSPFTGVTPIIPPTAIVPSDTDGSDVGTPLGSTINKTGSCLHSRSVSLESPRPVETVKNKSDPKASDSLFSSLEDKGDNQEGIQTRRRSSGTSDGSLIPAGQKRQNVAAAVTDTHKPKTSSGETSDQISPEIPYQDQAVSSSGSIENTALIPSTGEPGSRVIAKWKDGFFYPGTVKGKDRYGRFQVKFDDGDSMTIKNQELLLVERLPVGQSVLVQTKVGDFESGMILEQKESDYVVETDMGSKGSYLPSQVILTGDQASCLISDKGKEIMLELPSQQPLPANVGDVSLENLVDTPRRSATKAPPSGSKVKEEGQGQGAKTRKRKLEALQPQATSTPTPNRKHDTASPKKRKTAAEGFKESPLLGATSSPVSTRKSPRKARVGLFTGDLGPIPTKKLFRGMLFLLTNVDKSAEQRKQEKELLQDSSLETSTGESASEEEVKEPFDKNHLKSQIEAGGGKILDNFDIEKIEASKKCFLLSSTYQRTIKYFQCLACGVPCVAHSWVIHSCMQERLLDHKAYILPAGISLEKKKLIEWKTRTDVLIGVKAFVSSKDTKFCECWSEILRFSKCIVLPKLQYSELDVIVTDSNCTQTVVRQAANHSVPLVSTEWVIQSLINGKQMKFDGHPRYQHDFMI